MESFRGADPVYEDAGQLVLLIAAEQLGNGSWRYTYSVAPGVNVALVTVPGPDMLPPHDATYGRIARDLGNARSPRTGGIRLPER